MNGKKSLSYKMKCIQKIQKELNNYHFSNRRRNNDDLIFDVYNKQKQNNPNTNRVINEKMNFNPVSNCNKNENLRYNNISTNNNDIKSSKNGNILYITNNYKSRPQLLKNNYHYNNLSCLNKCHSYSNYNDLKTESNKNNIRYRAPNIEKIINHIFNQNRKKNSNSINRSHDCDKQKNNINYHYLNEFSNEKILKEKNNKYHSIKQLLHSERKELRRPLRINEIWVGQHIRNMKKKIREKELPKYWEIQIKVKNTKEEIKKQIEKEQDMIAKNQFDNEEKEITKEKYDSKRNKRLMEENIRSYNALSSEFKKEKNKNEQLVKELNKKNSCVINLEKKLKEEIMKNNNSKNELYIQQNNIAYLSKGLIEERKRYNGLRFELLEKMYNIMILEKNLKKERKKNNDSNELLIKERNNMIKLQRELSEKKNNITILENQLKIKSDLYDKVGKMLEEQIEENKFLKNKISGD